MDQLDESDKKGNGHNTTINPFAPLFELDDEEDTKARQKPKKTPTILLSEGEDGDKNKG